MSWCSDSSGGGGGESCDEEEEEERGALLQGVSILEQMEPRSAAREGKRTDPFWTLVVVTFTVNTRKLDE